MGNMLGNHKVHWNYREESGKKTTTCVIKDLNDQVLATGNATLFHKDVDDRKVARSVTFKRAMGEAMTNNTLDKSARAAIWEDFRTKITQPESI